jgi:CRP-like cAMP-binding protein
VTERQFALPISSRRALLPHTDNNLLAHLPPDDFDLFSHRLRTTDLTQGSDLLAAGDPIRNIYFPHSGIISLVVRLRTGGVIEAAMVGRDSLFGASAALDGQIGLYDAIVQLSGRASVLDVEVLRTAAEKSATLRKTLIRHEQALFAQKLQC